MKRTFRSALVFALVGFVLVGMVPIPSSAASTKASFGEQVLGTTSMNASGVLFIENMGQFDSPVLFQTWGAEETTWLAPNAQWLTLSEAVDPDVVELNAQVANVEQTQVNLRLTFAGANENVEIEPFGAVDTKVSYFIGADADAWQIAVPVWRGVRYLNLYDGIDLEVTSQGGQLLRRLIVKSETGQQNLAQVLLSIEGAESLAVGDGTVKIETTLGSVNLALLQVVDGRTNAVASLDETLALGTASVQGDVITAPFANVAAVPTTASTSGLTYATFLGGSTYDYGYGIAVDGAGSAYVTGNVHSTDFPAVSGPGADTTHNGDYDAFVAKFSPNGQSLEYITFLGGSEYDHGYAIAVDANEAAYVTGYTYSTDFPAAAGPGYDTTANNSNDAFVVKLAANGLSLVYATFLGGDLGDTGRGITVDAAGAAYVVGSTASDNFPAAVGPGYETSLADDAKSDAFVVKLAANGLSLTYATFLGGISYDFGNGIAVDAAGAAYVTGRTQSSDFPAAISSGYDNTLTGSSDAFAVKLSSDGLSLGYATFLGGNNFEEGLSVAVDATGAAYYTGYTASADFPTTLAYDTTQNGSFDAYVVKLATDGLSLLYGTFIGGATDDEGYGIVLDDDGAAYIAGYTASTDFPAALGPGYDDTYNDTGASDGFLVKLAPDATSLEYATFLGGDDGDSAYALAMGPANAVYVTGYAKSTNFPASLGPGYDTTQNGSADAFVVKLITGAAPVFVPLVLR